MSDYLLCVKDPMTDLFKVGEKYEIIDGEVRSEKVGKHILVMPSKVVMFMYRRCFKRVSESEVTHERTD